MWNYQSDFPSNWNDMGIYNNLGSGNELAVATGVYGFMAGAYAVLMSVAFVALYIIIAMALIKISKKAKIGIPWFAWVPILNSVLILNIAGLSGWYLPLLAVLVFIPVLGWMGAVLLLVYIWMRFAVVCKKPDYLGLLAAIPPMAVLLLLYFAYGDMLDVKK